MDVLCPVCAQVLEQGAAQWRCPEGHCFDVARQGYVNLLTVERKHSRHPGDTRQMVAARKRFLDSGVYLPIAQAAERLLAPLAPKRILDVGCGEGYYLNFLAKAAPGRRCVGVDISKDAVRFAAVRDPAQLWLTATAARLPFPAESFDAVTCLFAMTAAEEFRRVLGPDGVFLQVLAGPEHLLGLKRLIYPQLLHKPKVLQPDLPGFRLAHTEKLSFSFSLESSQAVDDLLTMTPHVWRISKEGARRVAEAQRLDDTAQVILNVYRPL